MPLSFGNIAPADAALRNKINPSSPLKINGIPLGQGTISAPTPSVSPISNYTQPPQNIGSFIKNPLDAIGGFLGNAYNGIKDFAGNVANSLDPIGAKDVQTPQSTQNVQNVQNAQTLQSNNQNASTLTPEQQASNAAMTKNGNYTFAGQNQNTLSQNTTYAPQNTINPFNSAVNGLQNIANNGGNPVANQASNYLYNQTQNNTPAQNSINTLQNISNGNNQQVTEANNQYNQFAQQSPLLLSDIRNNPNVAAEVSSGRGQVLGQILSGEQQALAQNVQNALANQGQQITSANQSGGLALTGQNQLLNAANQSGNLALTNQGQNITALQNAGSLSQPISQFGVLGTPQSVGPFGSNTGSAAFQGGYIGGQQAAGQQAAQMNIANTAAKGIQGTIQQYLQENPNLNPSDATFANSIAQWAQGQQLGDPKYQTLANYLNEYISTLAPILGVGGDTTNLKTQIAQSFINGQASGKNISEVLNSIGDLAEQKYQNIVSAAQGGGQVAGGQPQGSTPTSFGTSW